MYFIKILNFMTEDNYANYKGLDDRKIKAGSFLLLKDETACFIYNGDLVEHEDIILLTEEEYNEIKGKPIEDPFLEAIKLLNQKNKELKNILDTIILDNLNMQIQIDTLITNSLGGV